VRFSKRARRRRDEDTINVTSLVDIIFNLLIFFMLTTSFSESRGLEIELPEASAADVAITSQDLTIALLKDGQMVVKGQAVRISELDAIFQSHKNTHVGGAVIVQADREVAHGRVVEVVDAAKRAGIKRLGIAAESK